MTNEIRISAKELRTIASYVGMLKEDDNQIITITTSDNSGIGQTVTFKISKDFERMDATDYEMW